jgi:predicted DNA-binding mobile mystery protein A
MKTSKKSGQNQRLLLERKVKPWLPLRTDRVPPSGWLKAIRGALGINSRQLAERLGIKHSAILQFEKREAEGTISLESIQKVAQAMRCRFVYAIVPDDPFNNLESILDAQAEKAAQVIVNTVDHTMRLEQQGLPAEGSADLVRDLAKKLKNDVDPSLWGKAKPQIRRKKI